MSSPQVGRSNSALEPPQALVDEARAIAIKTLERCTSFDDDAGVETIDTIAAPEQIADEVIGVAWAARIDVALIRQACFDPGKFVPREFTDHGDEGWPQGVEYEPLHAWQARAIAAALGGDDR